MGDPHQKEPSRLVLRTKKSNCEEMVKHIAHSHYLSMDQTIEDLNLPSEIDKPLSTSTSNLHLNYKCPLGYGAVNNAPPFKGLDGGQKWPVTLSWPFLMAICIMLNFIHNILTDDAKKLGLFKLKGVRARFIAALALYHLIVKSKGDILENTLDWATHDILEALLKPMGLGT
ncbi:hypothetical protein BJY52DRAFT_1232661 [Lactarius psammicola]|nr:hypothetical protein BJY52DRAFT_1232661 [Lactarius psammicola]